MLNIVAKENEIGNGNDKDESFINFRFLRLLYTMIWIGELK